MTQRRIFDADLDELKGRILRMGGLCEEMIGHASKILFERETASLGEVRTRENEVNRLHLEIDELCLKAIALHQPAAGDLRLVAAALKINSDLERVGDQAVNIAETSTILAGLPEIKFGDVPRMIRLATEMLKDSLDAFTAADVALARRVIERDDEEDKLKGRVFDELVVRMQDDASIVQRGLDVILIARNLERIADHATNIAEDVIFMTLGKDIRHRAEAPADS